MKDYFWLKTRPAFILTCLLIALSLFLPVARAQETAPTPTVPGNVLRTVEPQPIPDTLPPVIVPPVDLFASAIDASGAAVNFAWPTANDETDGPVDVTCDWDRGAIFPLGTSGVTCRASDRAGNASSMIFHVTVVDQTPPLFPFLPDVFLTAADPAGAVVTFLLPVASDNVDAAVNVSCDWGSGAFFPVGTTLVSCWANDAAGNTSTAAFHVVVGPPPTPVPTLAAEPTQSPTIAAPTSEPTEAPETPETPVTTPVATAVSTVPATEVPPTATVPAGTEEPSPSATPSTTPTLTPPSTPTLTPSPTPTVAPTPSPTMPPPTVVPVPEKLDLPWPPPGQFTINTYGGPLNGIDAIWGYQPFPISQEFGHTDFSIVHFTWYSYGMAYGLDGYEHPGLDVAMPAGTWLYSPVEGTVSISGGTPHYTYYGNGNPGVGELLIVTDDGNEVILGHMGRIAVEVGDRVSVGDFVGLSGGDNGDHLHLEVREVQQGGWYRAVDPRGSFIVEVLKAAALPAEEPEVEATPAPRLDIPPFIFSPGQPNGSALEPASVAG